MPRSGSKHSQEGFARDKPPETSRKEIKDAYLPTPYFRFASVPPRPCDRGEGEGWMEEEVEEKVEMVKDDDEGGGGEGGKSF